MNPLTSLTNRQARSSRSSAVGVSFDAGFVRIVELTDKGMTLRALGEAPLPASAIASGEIHSPEVVGKALAEAAAAAGISQRRVDIAVGGPRVALRLLEVPDMPEAELQSSLHFQVGDLLPIPAADTVIDYQPVGYLEGTDGKRTRQVLVIASHREQIRGYLEAARYAGLSVGTVDSAPLALARAMRDVLAPYDLTTGAAPVEGIVHIGPDITSVVVASGGTTLFGRTLGAGTAADGLDLDGDPVATADRLFPLMEDIRNTLAFAISQVARERLSRVLLIADAAIEPTLVECLQATIGVPVQPVWVTHLADARGTAGADAVDGSYAVAFALACNRLSPSDDHVPSLLPSEVRAEAKRRRELVLAGSGVAVVAASLTLVSLVHAGMVAKAHDDLSASQKQEQTLQTRASGLADVEATNQRVATQQVTLRTALGSAVDVPRLLNDIADHLPADAAVKGVTISPTGVDLQMTGATKDSAANALEALSTSPRLKDLWIPGITFTDTGAAVDANATGSGTPDGATAAKSVVDFSIKATVTEAAATGRAAEFEVKK